MSARYIVGIDLGTSHTVVAYAARDGDGEIKQLPITQLVARGELDAPPLLPSVRYHPAAGELAEADVRLPWSGRDGSERDDGAIIGRLARELAEAVPGRAVTSAKSWLSHAGVDRAAPILPWGAADDVARISLLDASASYLAHVRAAWHAQFPHDPLERQDIVLTVPASFDEGARALTLEAARRAGLPSPRLLEEPQAAFYDWLLRHGDRLASELADTRLLLVCDIGGGTTDLTLIEVAPDPAGGPPRLTRTAVGEHLMLGGDNMDLALAHHVERGHGAKLPAARFAQLVQRVRSAKENLLAADAPAQARLTLLDRGARLVGGAHTLELQRDDAVRLVLDGFFPQEAIDVPPQRRRAALVEYGLPYPADPAISRHLAAFLNRHDARPDTVLFNGGVFRAEAIRARLCDRLAAWRDGAPPRELLNDQPDLAVARGAVAYALVRAGLTPLGADIGGGSARSYFLQLGERKGRSAPAEDAEATPRALCVLPRGTPSGQEIALDHHEFALRTGEAVRFHLLATTATTPWQAGELCAEDADDFVHLPPLVAHLPAASGQRGRQVAVRLAATMTEVGTLELTCIARDDPTQRWQLAFELRGTASAEPPPGAPPERVQDAIAAIERVFGAQARDADPKEVRQLRAHLERLLGPRDEWDLGLARTLADALLARARRRRRSAEHERVWCNLTGFCLRPGCGAPLDAQRIEQLWPLFAQDLQHGGETRNWSEWWTLWRRVAGGLDEARQLEVLEVLAGHLEHADPKSRQPRARSYDDMVRLTAALERVPLHHRSEVGAWLLGRVARRDENPQTWWALGRVGARESLYGSAHTVVPPDIAGEWLERVLACDWKAVEPAAFAVTQIARRTGDRSRDLPAGLRDEVVRRLQAARAPAGWIALVSAGAPLDADDQRRSYGESLPPGLSLL